MGYTAIQNVLSASGVKFKSGVFEFDPIIHQFESAQLLSRAAFQISILGSLTLIFDETGEYFAHDVYEDGEMHLEFANKNSVEKIESINLVGEL